nr:MAG TPA: hypothetical protein [Caudoviricetes sp.]
MFMCVHLCCIKKEASSASLLSMITRSAENKINVHDLS